MKKMISIVIISLMVFACSHKTATTTSETTTKTSSASVTNAQYSEGQTVYEANCAKCHKLKAPASHTPGEWTTWIDKMAPKAKISDEQKEQIFNYVSVNAKVN